MHQYYLLLQFLLGYFHKFLNFKLRYCNRLKLASTRYRLAHFIDNITYSILVGHKINTVS